MRDLMPVSEVPTGGVEVRRLTQSCRGFWISPLQSDLLDLSRWLAAFLVVIEHVRSLMFASYAAHSPADWLGKGFYFMTGFGHEAVVIFFVMSGFLVGGKILEQYAQGSFSWQKYTVDRASRLYAVYVLALLLGGSLDALGLRYFNAFGLYDLGFSGIVPPVNQNIEQNLSASVFLTNLGMGQTLWGPVLGSNGPLWSLAHEFWYYLAGPAVGCVLFCRDWRTRLLGGGALAAWALLLPSYVVIYFIVWLLGAGLYFVNRRAWLPLRVSLPLFLVCFSVARLEVIPARFLSHVLIAISFALVINTAAGRTERIVAHVLHRRAADFSYSVYLCHFPLLVFVLSGWFQLTGSGLRDVWKSSGMLGVLCLVGMVYFLSLAVSLVTERQTPRIRRWLYRAVGLNVISQRSIA